MGGVRVELWGYDGLLILLELPVSYSLLSFATNPECDKIVSIDLTRMVAVMDALDVALLCCTTSGPTAAGVSNSNSCCSRRCCCALRPASAGVNAKGGGGAAADDTADDDDRYLPVM